MSVSQIEAEMEALAELDESLIFTQPIVTSQEGDQVEAKTITDESAGILCETVQSLPLSLMHYDVQAEVGKRIRVRRERYQFVSHVSSSEALRLRVMQNGTIQLGQGLGQPIMDFVENQLNMVASNTPAAMKAAGRNTEQVFARRTWLRMQTQWVAWRLANLEKSDPQQYLGALLTGQNVVNVVKYRLLVYVNDSKELLANFSTLLPKSGAHGHFSALNSNKMSPLQRCGHYGPKWPMVLCFCVNERSDCDMTSTPRYMLSDGWWWCPAHLDSGLEALAKRGLSRMETKFVFSLQDFLSLPGHRRCHLR